VFLGCSELRLGEVNTVLLVCTCAAHTCKGSTLAAAAAETTCTAALCLLLLLLRCGVSPPDGPTGHLIAEVCRCCTALDTPHIQCAGAVLPWTHPTYSVQALYCPGHTPHTVCRRCTALDTPHIQCAGAATCPPWALRKLHHARPLCHLSCPAPGLHAPTPVDVGDPAFVLCINSCSLTHP
jgi:hypothetical protein